MTSVELIDVGGLIMMVSGVRINPPIGLSGVADRTPRTRLPLLIGGLCREWRVQLVVCMYKLDWIAWSNLRSTVSRVKMPHKANALAI